jgi:nucleotide-binding universal stress UspA family protein
MIKTLLLHASEDAGLDARLEAAIACARSFDGHLICLQVTAVDTIFVGDPLGDSYALPVIADEIRDRQNRHRQRIEARLRESGVSWEWLQRDGLAFEEILATSRLADAIVLSSAVPGGEHDLGTIASRIALRARAIVLAIPAALSSFDPRGTALVAWNDSPEAAHALSLALPILHTAREVQLVHVREDASSGSCDAAGDYLRRHGIASEIHEWDPLGRSVGETLIDAARLVKADFIVMGAYGHSRFAELVLGGATRAMLRNTPVPLLLSH